MTELLPCPFCGMKPPEDLSDTLYPTGTWWRWGKDSWREYVGHRDRKPGDEPMIRMHCTECMGGCGAEITGHSNDEAIAKWNRRSPALTPEGSRMTDREAFEAWERSEGLPLDRFPEDDRFSWPLPGRYKHKMVDAHWSAWQAAIKAEREACAKVCEGEAVDFLDTGEREDAAYNMATEHCAAAIRARGEA